MTGVPGSPVVLLVSFSYSLAFLFSKGEVLPSNPYGFINETLTLNCTVTTDSYPGNVSGSLFFVKDFDDVEKVLPMQYITPLGDRSIQLDYPITSGIHQGPYTCKLNTTDGNSVLIGSQYVSVDYRPQKVEKVDCRVFDWRNMTCTWDLGVDFINENRLNVQLQWEIFGGLFVCLRQTRTSCSWKEHDADDSFKLETYSMRVNVTTYDNDKHESVIDEALSNFITVDTSSLVQPAPVHSLTVDNRTSRCLSLRWNHTQYRRSIMYTVHVLQEQGSVLKFNTSEREITVCDLHPAWPYRLQVSCIPLKSEPNETSGFYSDWTSIEAETLEDVPTGVPGTQIGSFVYSNCNQTQVCTVIIYWQPIPLEESNGEITLYRIKQEDTQLGISKVKDVAGSATSCDLQVRKDRKYSITVRGRTRLGMSEESKPIGIPAFHKVPHPSDIVVEADSSTLYISWGVPPGSRDSHHGRVTGYTLYYCNGSKITSQCQDSIHWLPFPPEVLSHDLKVPDGNLDNKIIGISVEKEIANQGVSSGIKWSSCLYAKNQVPPAPQSVNFSRLQPDNALSVEWQRFDCAENPVYITHYVLSYCAAHQHGGCKGPSVQVSVSNTKESHVISDLSAGVKYRVTLRAVSRTGEGPESEPIFKEVVNSDLTPGEIAGISIGGIFGCIVLLSLLICCVRKARRTYRNVHMEIKLPTLVQVDDDRQVCDKENNNYNDLRKDTPASANKNQTDTSRKISRLEGILNPKSKSDLTEKHAKEIEIDQQDLKPLCEQVKFPCSGESTDSVCDKTKISRSDTTEISSSLEDSYLKLALSGNSDSNRQDAGSDYITRDKLSLLLGKTTPCDAPFDESSHSSGQDTASSPPPPYEPPRSPEDQQLETPPPTYSFYVSSSQVDSSSPPKDRQMVSCPVGDKLNNSATNSHPLSTLMEHQSPSSSPSDVPYDQSQPHPESTDPQGPNVAPKPPSESHATDSPYIPFDKVQPPQPPQGEEQKTDSPPADGYVSVSDASQIFPCPMDDNSSPTNTHPLSTLLEHQSPSRLPSDVPYDQSQPEEVAPGPQGHNITHKPSSESHSTDGTNIPFDKVQPPHPPQPPQPPQLHEEQKTVPPPADGYVSVSDASQMWMNKPGVEKPEDFCPTIESGNYCKIGKNGSLRQLSNSDYISQTDVVKPTAVCSSSGPAQEMTTTL